MKVAADARRQAGQSCNVPANTVHSEGGIVLEEGEDDKLNEEDIAIEEEAAVTADAILGDGGRGVHDRAAVKTLRAKAIRIMTNQGIISYNPSESDRSLGES
jgi:fructose-1,6-bisphosphatase/sedoheptulose 1,7-bisphosphatase-like protein